MLTSALCLLYYLVGANRSFNFKKSRCLVSSPSHHTKQLFCPVINFDIVICIFTLFFLIKLQVIAIYITRKYPLRGCILGSGATETQGVTLGAFLSPLRHMEQLLLVMSCDSPAGIGASLRTHGCTDGHRMDRRDVGNSILDLLFSFCDPMSFRKFSKRLVIMKTLFPRRQFFRFPGDGQH